MVLVSNFLFNLACSIVSCNPKHSYPTDPADTFRNSLEVERYRSSGIQSELNAEFEKYPVVSTHTGKLEGYTMETISGKSIYAFEGIPYGETTGGKNRFQPPVPKRKWAGIRKAHSPGSLCLQSYYGRIPLLQGREDCLFLSIYTIRESINSTEKLPVIFWLHGGGFNFGGGSDYGPSYMLEHDVLMVSINYRLNIFGFLSTGDDVVPGNNGLKDQALALKWVHDNIHNFGGDPNRITIMGQSAGGASVHFHMISSYYETREKSSQQRYFANAISMSGSAFSFWALRSKEKNRDLNRKLAKKAGCPLPNGQNSQQFVDCLTNIHPYILNSIQFRLFPVSFVPIILFGPVIEAPRNSTIVRANNNDDNNDLGRPFLTRHPDDLYAEGAVAKIPWMVSRTSGEAFLVSFIINGFGLLSRLAINYLWKNLGADLFDYRIIVPDADEITQRIQNHYFGGKNLSEIDNTVFDHIFTARAHTTATHKAIQSHSEVAPTHAMLLSGPINYELTLTSLMGPTGKQPNGVIHADDVFLIFNVSDTVRGLKSTENEFKLSRVLTEFVFNFANNGSTSYSGQVRSDINEHWDAVVDPCKVRYLNVTLNDGNQMVELPRKTLENYDFWLTLGLSDLQKAPSVPLPTCSSKTD